MNRVSRTSGSSSPRLGLLDELDLTGQQVLAAAPEVHEVLLGRPPELGLGPGHLHRLLDHRVEGPGGLAQLVVAGDLQFGLVDGGVAGVAYALHQGGKGDGGGVDHLAGPGR